MWPDAEDEIPTSAVRFGEYITFHIAPSSHISVIPQPTILIDSILH